jgi:hypothetical protein
MDPTSGHGSIGARTWLDERSFELSMSRIGIRYRVKPGSLIRFRCQGEEVLTRVTRVARYTDFDAMFDSESVASVNPLATREEQPLCTSYRIGDYETCPERRTVCHAHGG